jgi:spore maturation protein CgeB
MEEIKKIFLLGTNFPPFLSSQMCKTLSSFGISVDYFNYRYSQLHRFRISNPLLNKFLKKKIIKFNPDVLLVNKGETLLPGFIKEISSLGIKTVNWAMDDPFDKRHKYNFLSNIEEYDYFFILDPFYLKKLRKVRGNKSYYLPCAAFPEIHKSQVPIQLRRYNVDLSFVGSYQPERENIFKNFLDYDFKIWGYNWKKAKSRVSSIVQKDIFTGNSMCLQFNKSKINLNIHNYLNKESACMRFFEIPSTMSFQLADYRKELPNLLKPKREVVLFKSIEEAKELTDYYLDNPDERDKISIAGYKRVIKEHTIGHRIKEILKKIS